jgi:hypothetical protein
MRQVLEDYMLWVRRQPGWSQSSRCRRVLVVRLFLDEQVEDGLAGMPRAAMIHRKELPRVEYRLPKDITDHVFAQWVDPDNLALLGDQVHRTVVMLLA